MGCPILTIVDPSHALLASPRPNWRRAVPPPPCRAGPGLMRGQSGCRRRTLCFGSAPSRLSDGSPPRADTVSHRFLASVSRILRLLTEILQPLLGQGAVKNMTILDLSHGDSWLQSLNSGTCQPEYWPARHVFSLLIVSQEQLPSVSHLGPCPSH